MRTYDKLIATIFARQAKGDLRLLPGASLLAEADDSVGPFHIPQDIG